MWTCPHCAAEVEEDDWIACWNCNRRRDATEAPADPVPSGNPPFTLATSSIVLYTVASIFFLALAVREVFREVVAPLEEPPAWTTNWMVTASLSIPASLLVAVGWWMARRHDKQSQPARDDDAVRVLATNTRFALYLRTFFSDREVLVPHEPPGWLFFVPSGFLGQGISFSQKLGHALGSEMPTTSLGRNTEIGIGGVVTSDEAWKDIFYQAARNAYVIFMMPLNRPATMFEVDWLMANGLLHKTIFLMPPERSWWSSRMAECWSDAAQALVSKKLLLPQYRRKGALFHFAQENGNYTIDLFVRTAPFARKTILRTANLVGAGQGPSDG